MITKQKKLPSVEDILQISPLPARLAERKKSFDGMLAENMRSRNRFVVVAGPCSADDATAVGEYCQRLHASRQKYGNLLLVARIYTSKPHSNGVGYKGLCFQHDVNSAVDLAQGIVAGRQLMINTLETGLPVADELLYPDLFPYFADLVSYWFVGARSAEDSLHRGIASMTDVCCGIKNATNGLVESAEQSLFAVAHPCVFPFGGCQTETSGNSLAHIVLRGGLGKEGFFSNISPSDTQKAKKLLQSQHLNDFVMVDLSHANSKKVAKNQLVNAVAVSTDANVDGVMAESYLFEGCSANSYGVSKTDECIGWKDTEKLLEILSDGFSKRAK